MTTDVVVMTASSQATTGMAGLLEPGAQLGYAVAGDAAILIAMVKAEQSWLEVLVAVGAASTELPSQLSGALVNRPLDRGAIAARTADGGNPVIPLVDDLRSRLGEGGHAVHRGLTSQDILDTAMMLVTRAALDDVTVSLQRLGDALARHAEAHRESVMAGRTLTQYAVPTTFGLKAAQWLTSVDEVLTDVETVRAGLPIQCGGAAGTLAGIQAVGPEPRALAQAWADSLDLRWPGSPWHTRRRPITRIGDVLAAVISTLGHLGTEITTLSRPEIGEVSEGLSEQQGRSSTMPHKRNPVGSVLIRAAGLQAGPLAGLLHQCAALAVDERSDGAWHAEWPTLQRLLVLAVTSAAQAATMLERLQVHADVMSARVDAVAETLLSERRGLTCRADPGADSTGQGPSQLPAADYLGA
ncbi:MAG: lyase family protein, partial [Ornithinimicrobium sp.]|uniref:lyase family protein n=1 Tax=Ornithinimicrobium sp. TaxID=1977084 RepID=UPI0026DFC4DA